MIVRIKKTEHFTVIANYAADGKLSLKAMGLFYFLMTKPDKWCITREGLKIQLQEGQRAIDAALKELEEAGYLERNKTKRADGQFLWNATLFEKPLLRKPLLQNATMDNATQVNTNIVNTDKVNTTSANAEGVPQEKPLPGQLIIGEGGEVLDENGVVIEDVPVAPLPAVVKSSTDQRGSPDINEVVEYFETAFKLKMNRAGKQRIAAHNLIRRYAKDVTLRGIDAALIVRDEEYAPQIVSLEDLWNKWNNLAEFYRKKQAAETAQKNKVAIITDDEE